MYQLRDIRILHLELSSRCNAGCPMCSRNLHGYPINMGYEERDMTLSQAQHMFQPEFIAQLDEVLLNGNFGDAVMNPETVDIVRYFRQHNTHMDIVLNTNGGARNRDFWQQLAQLGVSVFFGIDGLEDTHDLHRRNTRYTTVLRNAQTFIAAGGFAVWKFIEFDHNSHQIESARELSNQLGFAFFHLEPDRARIAGPVFNAQGEWIYDIGQHSLGQDLAPLMLQAQSHKYDAGAINDEIKQPICCEVQHRRSVYVNSTGHVYPCCYIGYNPETFWGRRGQQQIRPLIKNNLALKHPLEECIQWFDQVEQTWQLPTFDQGRLIVCNRQCGQSL